MLERQFKVWLPDQFLDNISGKVMDDAPSTWAPATNAEHLAFDFNLTQPW